MLTAGADVQVEYLDSYAAVIPLVHVRWPTFEEAFKQAVEGQVFSRPQNSIRHS